MVESHRDPKLGKNNDSKHTSVKREYTLIKIYQTKSHSHTVRDLGWEVNKNTS